MNPDNLLSLADSKNVALVISLFGNVVLFLMLRRVYQAKEKLHGQLTEFLKVLVPFALNLRGSTKNDQD